MKLLTICDHTFDTSRVTPGAVVLDLGVNLGQFGSALAAGFQARVFGVEADARLFGGATGDRWPFPVLHGALAAQPGRLRLHLNGGDFCPSVLYGQGAEGAGSIEVECFTLAQLWQRWSLTGAHLVKMDIEGAEVEVLAQAPESLLTTIEQITCEFHDFMDPGSLPAVQAVCRRMEKLGFRVIRFSREDYGNVLFLNGRVADFGTLGARLHLAAYRSLRRLKHQVSGAA